MFATLVTSFLRHSDFPTDIPLIPQFRLVAIKNNNDVRAPVGPYIVDPERSWQLQPPYCPSYGLELSCEIKHHPLLFGSLRLHHSAYVNIVCQVHLLMPLSITMTSELRSVRRSLIQEGVANYNLHTVPHMADVTPNYATESSITLCFWKPCWLHHSVYVNIVNCQKLIQT